MSLTKAQLALSAANLDIQNQELMAKNNDLVASCEELHTRSIDFETRSSLILMENERLQQQLHTKRSRARKSRNLVTNSRCFTSGTEPIQRNSHRQAEESNRAAKAAKDAEQVLRRTQQSNTIFTGSLSSKTKSDLQDIANALRLKVDGLKAALLENIRKHLEDNPEQHKTAQFCGLSDCPQKRRASSQDDENQPPTNRPRLGASITHLSAQG